MKKITIIILLTLAMVFPLSTYAAYIDLKSSFCSSIGASDTGRIDEEGWSIMHQWNVSDESGFSILNPGNPDLDIDEFITASAIVDVHESTAFLYAQLYGGGKTDTQIIFNTVGASYIRLSAHEMDGGGDTGGEVRLIDMTTSSEMLFYSGFQGIVYNIRLHGEDLTSTIFDYENRWGTVPYEEFGKLDNLLFAVDPTHTYKLITTSFSGGVSDGSHIWTSITLIPEPASILLLGLGLMILARVRKNIKN